MNFAIVGCGYVAELYLRTLANHPSLTLAGAYDRNPENLAGFARISGARSYASLEELAADPGVGLVLNLTNPRSHYEVTRQCLEAGKHVYSEKPLAMAPGQAQELAELAARRGLRLASAPCSVLAGAAQTLWKAVRDGRVGRVRLVYANFDDGMIAPRQTPWQWRNEAGVPWPAKDEFEVGCTYEHAGYVLTWLAAMFGPVRNVVSYASCQIPEKGIAVDSMAPDFVVGCLEFAQGVVARLTCGLVAPRDKSITVVGDDGVLFVGNVRDDDAPVFERRAQLGDFQAAIARRSQWLQRWLESRGFGAVRESLFQRRVAPCRAPRGRVVSPDKPVDFLLGPAELADAVGAGRPCRLSPELGVHVVEVIEALQYPERFGGRKRMTTGFEPMRPMPWAQ